MRTIILATEWNEVLKEWITKLGLSSGNTNLIYNTSIIILTLVVSVVAYYLLNILLKRILPTFSKQHKSELQVALRNNNVFRKISFYLPLTIVHYTMSLLLVNSFWSSIIDRVYQILIIVLFVLVANSLLNTFVEISQYKQQNRSKPIKGLVQFLQILIYFFAALIIFSLIISKEPGKLIAGLGAASAIVMLIFKDSITGLVAGIQLSSNKMVKIGDWISLSKYDVDGEVIDITLTSVKVQNWDKTISTIPAYNLIVSDSVKNWEGMTAYGGRRIARSVNINIGSVKFCTSEMLERFRKIQYVAKYIDRTEKEIEAYNKENGVDNSMLVNGRRQTNLGIFRAYMVAYLRQMPGVNQDMTLMVRQLEPTINGIPIQIYCFAATTEWAKYENIQSDIFDHILAVISAFDLKISQAPTGADFTSALKG